MRWISHRGNIWGKQPDRENHPTYIFEALAEGYWCEIDVWVAGTGVMLGHDAPQYSVNENMLKNPKLICHAKNKEALSYMLGIKKIHCFWHDSDDYALTSRNWIWAYPGKPAVGKNCYIALPELYNDDVTNFKGICSDIIGEYKHG